MVGFGTFPARVLKRTTFPMNPARVMRTSITVPTGSRRCLKSPSRFILLAPLTDSRRLDLKGHAPGRGALHFSRTTPPAVEHLVDDDLARDEPVRDVDRRAVVAGIAAFGRAPVEPPEMFAAWAGPASDSVASRATSNPHRT